MLDRRNFLATASLLALGQQLGACARTSGKPPPNFLVVIADDLRWDSIGAMGNRLAVSPTIDRLAMGGTLFKNGFVTTSICWTSRASIVTGQYARRHGIWGATQHLSAEQMAATYPVLLRQHGYRTGFVGKWGMGGPMPHESFDMWHGYAGQGRYFDPARPGKHLSTLLDEQAADFIHTHKQDKPFCLVYCSKEVHEQNEYAHDPYWPKAELTDYFRGVTFPKPATANQESFDALPEFLRVSEGRLRWIPRFATDDMFQNNMRAYYQLLLELDQSVGRMLKSLEDKGLLDNTFVIFTSDNGNMLGDHGLAGKWWMFEESIRIPLIIYPPRHMTTAMARVSDKVALNIDLAPTILDLAGVPPHERMQGRSLAPLLQSQVSDWREEFLYEHLCELPHIIKSVGLRQPRYKYVRYFDIEMVFESMFDLDTDPYEEHDVARIAEMEQRRAAMSAKVDALIRAVS